MSYLGFDHGDWKRFDLSDDAIAWIDDAGSYAHTMLCGHWSVLLVEFAGIPKRPQTLKWEYDIFVSVPNPDPEREPLLCESMLVRDFPSLLKLLAMLRSADVDIAPDSSDR